MIEVKGKYSSAKIFTDNIEETAMGQVVELCNQEFVKGSKIRIMPDVHAGAGCTIGTTMTIKDKVVPNLVGVDIGCGLEVVYIDIDKSEVNFDQLDDVIRKHVPSGFAVRGKAHKYTEQVPLDIVRAPINENRAKLSVGTLGGGNHFVELNEVEPGKVALVIHSGSRSLGKQIAEHYQDKAYKELMNVKNEQQQIIEELKSQGRAHEIHEALRGIKKPKAKKDLAYVQGSSFEDYMNDMSIAQLHACWNRRAMVQQIVSHMGWSIVDQFTTIHNYIDMEYMILRKGAISARAGERVIIPINMRDGSLIAEGKGNPDWNFSGPHGAGRVMSRSKAKKNLKVEDFKKSMEGIWTSSVNENTLDEAPMVYKPLDEIRENIEEGGAVKVLQVIKPVYNFKA
ncbi:RtcB family protein [Bacillus subtilis]|uniref:RtcB family protein n=1 Tax=Bacillus subtilis TaxID=1423 RepID=UPI0011CCD85B|nr:RtcB family protein [Bacillus subtilis]TXK63697.1 RtcB family protein [Bacillus subtilis]HEQ3553552.1 RtcB family protein [Enterococcus faecalis]